MALTQCGCEHCVPCPGSATAVAEQKGWHGIDFSKLSAAIQANAGLGHAKHAADAAAHGGQCAAPSYDGCGDCQASANSFGCWCNEGSSPPNIYGSGGCQNGGDCMWTLVSDIWNGVSGDAGYAGCMTAVPAIGLDKGKPNLKSTCALSVEKLVLRGSGEGGKLSFGKGSPAACAVLTV